MTYKVSKKENNQASIHFLNKTRLRASKTFLAEKNLVRALFEKENKISRLTTQHS